MKRTLLPSLILLLLPLVPAAAQFLPRPHISRPAGFAFPDPDTLEILFIGDVMSHEEQLSAARRKDGSYCFEGYFTGIRPLVRDCDITVANIEFPVGRDGDACSGYPSFMGPEELVREAAREGVGVMLSANNHICDKGARGLKSTLEVMEELEKQYGVRHTGAYRDRAAQEAGTPLTVTACGISVAMVNFTYGTNGIPVPEPYRVNLEDTAQIGAAIDRARAAGADAIIALPHWGTEYRLKHDGAQEKLARWLTARGADAVIGTHPHVPQDMDTVNGKPVLYSLGNFISNMSAPNTRAGLAAVLRIVKLPSGKVLVSIPRVEYLWCSRRGFRTDGYTTGIIRLLEGRRDEWKVPYDYDNMISTRDRIEKILEIEKRNSEYGSKQQDNHPGRD